MATHTLLGPVWQSSGSFKNNSGSGSGSSGGATSLVELELFWETFGKTASPVELGCKIVGAAWSHVFVAPPPQWKPEGAPGAAPWLELLHFRPFGWALAGAGAVTNRATQRHIANSSATPQYRRFRRASSAETFAAPAKVFRR